MNANTTQAYKQGRKDLLAELLEWAHQEQHDCLTFLGTKVWWVVEDKFEQMQKEL